MREIIKKSVVLCAMAFLVAMVLVPSVTAFQGNSTNDQPNFTSSPTTYKITDSTPTGSSISSTGLVLSTDMETLRTAKLKNFANSNDGTITNSIPSKQGVRGSSYETVGSNIAFPLLSTKNVNISFGGWYYPHVSPMARGCVFSTGNGSTNGFTWGFGDYTTMNHIYYLCPGGAGWGDTGIDFNARVWYSVFWTLSWANAANTLVKCYVNGVLEYSATIANCVVPFWSSHIATDGAGSFDGLIDENLMFERVLTPTEVTTLYTDSFTKYVPAVSSYVYEPTASQTIVTWALETNATWLTQTPANGTISGTPLTFGSWYVNVTGTNLNGYAYQNYTILSYQSSVPVIIPAHITSPNFFRHLINEDVTYWANYSADQVVTWSFTSDASWLSWDGTSITGTPGYDDQGTYYAHLTATNVNGVDTLDQMIVVLDVPYGQPTSLLMDIVPLIVLVMILAPIIGFMALTLRRKP